MGNQYKQLTIKERYQIEAFCTLGFSARKMATELGRSNKTISRELALCPDDKYCAEMSHQQVHLRRRDAAKYHKCSAILKEVIRPLLVLGLSPEQIAGRMNIETVSNYLSCNTIYTLVKREQWQHLLARKGEACKKRKLFEGGCRLITGPLKARPFLFAWLAPFLQLARLSIAMFVS